MTDQPTPETLRDQYAAAINAKIDGTAGCANGHRLADAVLAVRDREMERMQLLVAASSEPGQAVRMAEQYADRAIENGKRAEQAEDLLRVAHETSNTSEAERARAVERAKQAEANRARVQERACRTAELLRHAEGRIVRAESVIARVRQMADAWEQRLPDAIRTATAVEALRAATDRVRQPTTTACVHPEGYEGECPCPPSCICCQPTT